HHARLTDLEQRLADPIAIADAHLAIGQALDREVFSELAKGKLGPTELAFPVAIRVQLIDEHGALLAAVTPDISLPVSVDVEPSHHSASGDGFLPDSRAHNVTAPVMLARQSDVDR